MTELETFITSNSKCTFDTSQLPADADYEWIVTESNLPYVPLYIPAQWPMICGEANELPITNIGIITVTVGAVFVFMVSVRVIRIIMKYIQNTGTCQVEMYHITGQT